MNQIIPFGIKRICRTVQATAGVCFFLASQLTAAASDGGVALLQKMRDSASQAVLTDGSDPTKAGVKVVQEWHGNILRSKLVNTGKQAVGVKEVVLFAGEYGLPGTTPFYAEGFQMLAQNGGTLAHPEDWGSFSDRGHYKLPEPASYRSVYGMLVLHPTNESALLLGFTSCHRFVGRFDLAADRLRIVQDAENLQLAPGQSWQLEEFMVATNASTDKLEAELARAIEKNHPHPLFRPEPTGWCSWYCYAEHVTAQDIYTNLDFIAAQLPSLKYIQIDDGYQPWMGDWLEPGNSFGGNVREVIERIRQRGFEPAIWLAPFVASPESKLFHDIRTGLFRIHPENHSVRTQFPLAAGGRGLGIAWMAPIPGRKNISNRFFAPCARIGAALTSSSTPLFGARFRVVGSTIRMRRAWKLTVGAWRPSAGGPAMHSFSVAIIRCGPRLA